MSNTSTTRHDAAFLFGGEQAVHRIGYGAMRLTGQPGNFGPYPDWEDGKKLLRRAVELGVTFFDTALAYGPQWNEKLIAEALHPYRDGVFVATKGGIDKLSASQMVRDASANALMAQIDQALINLKKDRIDLFQLHWVDGKTPIEESVRAMDVARQAGKVRFFGFCNITASEFERARAVAPIASVQNRYNILEREHDALVDLTAERGVAFIPYGPLGANPMQKGAPLAQGTSDTNRTAAQSALRQLLDRSPNIVVIPGTTSIAHLEENLAA